MRIKSFYFCPIGFQQKKSAQDSCQDHLQDQGKPGFLLLLEVPIQKISVFSFNFSLQEI
jgi:hypothetical protein